MKIVAKWGLCPHEKSNPKCSRLLLASVYFSSTGNRKTTGTSQNRHILHPHNTSHFNPGLFVSPCGKFGDYADGHKRRFDA